MHCFLQVLIDSKLSMLRPLEEEGLEQTIVILKYYIAVEDCCCTTTWKLVAIRTVRIDLKRRLRAERVDKPKARKVEKHRRMGLHILVELRMAQLLHSHSIALKSIDWQLESNTGSLEGLNTRIEYSKWDI